MSSSETIKDFLTLLFEYKQDDQHILLWTLPDKESAWFEHPDIAAHYARRVSDEGRDVYFGLGLAAKDYGPHKRATADQIVALPGLWMDIDLKSDTAHKKANLPANLSDAEKILDPMPAPTMIVNSGYGLHVYWLFKEVWNLDTPAEHESAKALVQGFSAAVQASAARLGYRLDSTIDLARVLRVAGTRNLKGGKSKPVSLYLEKDRPRYDPSDLREYVLAPEHASEAPAADVGGLAVMANAAPPFIKFQALYDAEPKFAASWLRKRPDLKDESASGYDLSLANLAAGAGWSDQEIVDLLVASRRKHGDNLKLREDYYRRTLVKVRSAMQSHTSDEGIDDVLAITDAVSRRIAALDELSRLFGMRVVRIIKHKTAEPIYHMVLAGGEIALGATPNLLEQRLLRYKIFDAINRRLPGFKPKKWLAVVDLIGVSIEEEEADDATTVVGMGAAWMQGYFKSRKPAQDMEDAIVDRSPFLKDGSIYFFLSDFRFWVKMAFGEPIAARKASFHLRRAGARRTVIAVAKEHNRKSDKPTSVSVWAAPGG